MTTIVFKTKTKQTANRVFLLRTILLSLIFCLIVCGTLFLIHHLVHEDIPSVEQENFQNEMLEELQNRRGEYDEQSIILSGTTPVAARQLADLIGAELRITKDGSFATLTLPEGTTILDVYQNEEYIELLPQMSIDYHARISEVVEEGTEEDEDVERVPSRPQYTVTDGSYALQTYLDYMNLRNVWATTKGKGVTVAIIDTGIDTDHPEFDGRISEYSYNATEDKIVKDYVLSDGSYDWSLIEDEQGHGTAVAGVIGAAMDGKGVVGVAPEVTLLVIKAECGPDGNFLRSSDLVFGLYYAIERDVSVVNMSVGGDGNPFADAARLAKDSDIICVAAAGNDATSSPSYPAADPNFLGVGALGTDSWELSWYSNYGDNSDIVAPGTTYTAQNGGGYSTIFGTSFACPNAVGVIALWCSLQPEIRMEVEDVRELIYASCYDIGDPGNDWYYGYGVIDVSALVLEEKGTVTFNMLTDELENVDQVFVRNHTLQNMPEPERLYAVFDGWYYDPHCIERVDLYEDEFSADLTLYAGWINESDGVPYTYTELDDGTIEICSYTGHRRYITVPDVIDGKIVSSIGDHAFKGQDRLREIILPSNLKHIKVGAFEGCNNLLHIDIPETVVSIGESAFADNIRLSYVAFGENSHLVSVGSSAFANCSSLKKFELPTKLTYMDGSAFFGATELTAFSIRPGNVTFSVKDGVLFNYTASTLVCYPAGLRGEYIVPDGVLTIGAYAFATSHITDIDLDGVQVIGMCAFRLSKLKTLVIPDSVEYMDKAAFVENFDLTTLKIGSGLTVIPERAFESCWSLTAVDIPENISTIKSFAFCYDGSISSLTFAENSRLTSIGAYAFFMNDLQTVEFPETLISIGGTAFAKNPLRLVSFGDESELREIYGFAFKETLLKTVTIPASVTKLGEGVFAACHSLTDITVAQGNNVYIDIDGVVYNKNITEIVAYPAGNARTSYTIEGNVTAVGEDAFYGAWNLNSVVLPEFLKEIRREAFYNCAGIESILIPDSVVQISHYAFADCWNLTSITLSDNSLLPRISYASFANCGLTSFRVPANVSTIAQGAFEGCHCLSSFTFAANSKLESISAYMFDGCNSLETVTFEKGSALTSIQAHGLEGMRKLTSIDFGDAKITNIDNFAFRFCEGLESIIIPEGITNIGRFAFYYCDSLTEVTLPTTLEHIGSFAFLGTENVSLYFSSSTLPAVLDEDWDYDVDGYYLGVIDVTETDDWKYAKLTDGAIAFIEYKGNETAVDLSALDLGGDIVNIGGSAFAYSKVEDIVLPETLVTIQAEAFYRSAIRSIAIPKSVEFIGRKAFADTNITSLIFEKNSIIMVIESSAFENTERLKSVTLPASLKTLGRSAFQNSGITTLIFEEDNALTEIPQGAFANTNINALTLPKGVTLIDHNAFRNTASLESVTWGSADFMVMSNAFYQSGLKNVHIPKNMTYIGEYAFVALSNLSAFTVDPDNAEYSAENGLLLGRNGRKLIAAPAGRTGTLTVPAGVEIIGFGAFEESKLTKIDFLPDANILSFGYRAFYGSDISEMYVPESVVAIDYYAFATCEKLTKVTFAEGNQLRGIYEGAFYGCESLSEITIPDEIMEISDFAFYGCISLDRLPINETNQLKGIYDYAFAYTGIEELTLPATLYDIGPYSFMGVRVNTVTVPDANKEELMIGIGAFEDCTALEKITLPFIGASFEDHYITWFGYIFGAGGADANAVYVPESLKEVTITEGISFVGERAFCDLKSLEKINIPHSVTVVYDRAFGDTTAKYEFTNTILPIGNSQWTYAASGGHFGMGIFGVLDLAEGTRAIETEAFLWRSNLESITLPNSLEKIERRAFDGCINLSTVVIPEGIKNIEEVTFCGCSGLVSVTIPASVTGIGQDAFMDCTNLSAIYNNSDLPLSIGSDEYGKIAKHAKIIVDKEGNKIYKDELSGFEFIETEDGFRFLKEHGEYSLIAYFGEEKTVTLPPEICESSYRIYKMKGAENVIVPEGITTIGDDAFMHCSALRSIIIPDSVTSIGSRAFEGCENLTSVTMSQNLIKIGDRAFCNCKSLTSIDLPDTVTDLGGTTFNGCESLLSVRIPKNVQVIGGCLFQHCTNLISVSIPEGVTDINYRAFNGCENLVSVTLPDTITYISDGAFMRCRKLKSLTVPKAVDSIGEGAFANCDQLTLSVEEGNERFVIVDDVLYDKEMTRIIFVANTVKEIVIPKTVTDISHVLEGHKTIEKVFFEEGIDLSSIGVSAFSGCSSLTSISFPEGVTRIEDGAFRECSSLTSFVIPDGVNYIGAYAFCECANLESISLPGGLEIINSGAFEKCISLKNITIPEGVTQLGSWTFMNCGALTSVVIPSTLTDIGYCSFLGCVNLKNIYITNVEAWLNITFGEYSEISYPNDEAILHVLDKNGLDITDLVIPEGVTNIPDSAFSNSTTLTSVTIPASLTSIGNRSFSGCTNLRVINNNSDLSFEFGSDKNGSIAENARVIIDKNGKATYRDTNSDFEYIDTEDGFRFMKENGEYYLVAYVGDADTVTLPTNIGGHSYQICHLNGLRNVIIPEGMTSIGDNAFSGCAFLESVQIPESVTKIGEKAFLGCSSLTNLTLPNGLTSIGNDAFRSCANLSEITIPDSVTHIGRSAFVGTAIYLDESNWDKGALIVDDCLIDLSATVEHFIRRDIQCIADDAFEECYKLKTLTIGGEFAWGLSKLTNLETLIITEMPRRICNYFGYFYYDLPITLKNVVIAESAKISLSAFYDEFENPITGITIYVEDTEKNTQWDENYFGWNPNNTVVYGGNWITVEFYDKEENLVKFDPNLTFEIIRLPQLSLKRGDQYSEVITGWDIDGDGNADSIPATYNTDIAVRAIVETALTNYTIRFYAEDGITLISKVILPYGSQITLPEIAEKKGYTIHGWKGYSEGMTVVQNLNLVLDRAHNGEGHEYSAPIWVEPSCTEQGYNKHICVICDEWYATDNRAANGHTYTSSVTDATCTDDGVIKYTCSDCGDIYYETIFAPGHSYNSKVLRKATCSKNGEILYTCNICGDERVELTEMAPHKYQKVKTNKHSIEWLIKQFFNIFYGYEGNIPYFFECKDCHHIQTSDEAIAVGTLSIKELCNHNLGDWRIISEASCELMATEGRTCATCKKVIEARITANALGHTEIIDKAVAPTCTETGLTEGKHCSVCNTVLVPQEVIKANGHTEVIDKAVAPTCTETGLTEGKHCSVCNTVLVEQEVIKANGHTEVIDKAVAPTCTETGLTEGKHCSACNEVLVKQTIVDALGHTEVIDKAVAPTCTETGLTEGKHCSVCNTVLVAQEVVKANGHTEVIDKAVAPTCTKTGLTEGKHCDVCKEVLVKQDVVDALGHTEVIDKAVVPTCTETGLTEGKHCDVCGEVLVKQIVVDAFGHTEVIDKAIAPTCTATGLTEGKHCSVCNTVIVAQTEVPVIAHSYDDKYDETCNECGFVRDAECAHTNTTVIAGKAPTCTESGLTDGSKCTKCGEILVEQEVIKANGHTEVIDKAVAPTCRETGLTEGKHCSVCNTVLVAQEVVKANGHTEVIDKAVAPTCTETGLTEGKHCDVCNTVLVAQTEVPMIAHTYDDKYDETCNECGFVRDAECAHTNTIIITGKAPTCTESGLTDGSKCTKCGEVIVAQEVIKANGHTEVIDKAVVPTCTEAGLTEGKHCSVCNTVLIAQEVVKPNGHTEVIDKAVAPTCTETGLTEGKHCDICKEVLVKQNVVEALGHTEVIDAAVDPTCTETGLTEGKHCNVCGEIIVAQKTVEKLVHTPSDWIIDKPADVGAEGKKHKECVDCGEILEEEVIDALPPEEKPTEKPTEEVTTNATDGTETEATDATQGEASSSNKPTENGGGCGSALLTMTPVIFVLTLAAIPTFLKKKREE